MAALMFVFVLGGCAASLQVPPQPVVEPVAVDDTPKALCLVRARLFKGLVAVPCSSLVQEFRP